MIEKINTLLFNMGSSVKTIDGFEIKGGHFRKKFSTQKACYNWIVGLEKRNNYIK